MVMHSNLFFLISDTEWFQLLKEPHAPQAGLDMHCSTSLRKMLEMSSLPINEGVLFQFK